MKEKYFTWYACYLREARDTKEKFKIISVKQKGQHQRRKPIYNTQHLKLKTLQHKPNQKALLI